MNETAIVLIVIAFVIPTLCIFGDDPQWKRGGKK